MDEWLRPTLRCAEIPQRGAHSTSINWKIWKIRWWLVWQGPCKKVVRSSVSPIKKKNGNGKTKHGESQFLGETLIRLPATSPIVLFFFTKFLGESPNFNFRHNLPSWIQASADSQRAAKLLLIEEPRKRLVKGIRKRALAEMAGVSSSLHSKNEMVDLWWI